ncbi:MAG: hypothetical protein WC515_03765 [Candidatus Omnitrophota bacterium]
MIILGIRCSTKDYCFAILDGSKKSPKLLQHNRILFPKNYTRPQELKWFSQEITDILEKNKIDAIAIKGTEGMASRGSPFVIRTENEAIIQLAAAIKGIKVYKKVNCTIAKDLGLKGRTQSLKTDLDYSVFQDFAEIDTCIQEAILVGWSTFHDAR